jgi:hypothetical protein
MRKAGALIWLLLFLFLFKDDELAEKVIHYNHYHGKNDFCDKVSA